jgi:16S rRNA C967 or C1407 C5-methylase (RsmB/RsmF family)
VPEIPDAYKLADPHDIARLRAMSIYEDGALYSQGLSSQIPALCMDLVPGLRVLDATAAPGSKTSQIASLMGDTGRIDACESAGIRYQKLLHTIRTQGCTSVSAHHLDTREWLAGLPSEDRYDRILLDPACSAMGRIWTEHEKTYAFWSSDLPARHARVQSALLDACLVRLAPGGVLVYSTCTLSTEENE